MAEYPFKDCFAIGQDLIKEYNKIPSLELWNVESINSTISQIQYYRDGGVFKDWHDLEIVVDSFEQCLNHIQLQADKGVKFMPGASDVSYKATLELYVNEVVLGSNTILVELDNSRLSFITYSVLSYLITRDARFNEKAFHSFHTLVSRSTLISSTGEKERNKFFNTMRVKINALRK